MEPTFASAIEHIKIMEDRILQQTEAIGLLKAMEQDTVDADRRLRLLNFAMVEMRPLRWSKTRSMPIAGCDC